MSDERRRSFIDEAEEDTLEIPLGFVDQVREIVYATTMDAEAALAALQEGRSVSQIAISWEKERG